MIRKLTIAFMLLLGMWVPLSSANELSQLFQDALNYDADYAASLAEFRAGLEKLPQARAGLLPQIQLSANTLETHFDTSLATPATNTFLASLGGVQNFDSNSVGITLTQPLFRQANSIQYDQAKLQLQANDARLEDKRQSLMLRVAAAYFDVLLAQDTLAALNAQKTAIQQELALAKANFSVGTATVTDADEALARFSLTEAHLIAVQNDLSVKRQALFMLTGARTEALSGLKNPHNLESVELNQLNSWIQSAIRMNPQIQIEQENLNIAQQEIARVRSGRLPTLDAVANYTYGNNQLFGNTLVNTRISYFGLILNFPLYQGGLVNSRVREAEANKDRAQQNLITLRRQIDVGIRQAALNINSEAMQVTAYAEAEKSSQSALESNQLGITAGVRTMIDLLNAEQQYYSTQRELAAARYGYWLSTLRLKSILGTLNEADLAEIR